MQTFYTIEGEGADAILKITCDAETQAELQAMDQRERWQDSTMHDAFERITCNGLSWVAPEDVGALTDSPLLSEGEYGLIGHWDGKDQYGADHDSDNPAPVFWYANYQVRSPLDDLAQYGEVIFTQS